MAVMETRCDFSGAKQELMIGAGVLRQGAVSVVSPIYPASSISAGHEGLAVVDVRVSHRGKVAYVGVIEAPDPAIGEAVKSAVKQWTFSPFRDRAKKVRYAVRSRLIFYFRKINGRPVVVDAAAEGVAVKRALRP